MKQILLIIFVMMHLTASAQMDIELQRLAGSRVGSASYRLAKKSQHLAKDNSVVVIAQIKADHKLPEQALLDMGVKIRSNYGRVAVLSVPIHKLMAVSELKEIDYLSTDHKSKLMNDSARFDTQVDSVQNEMIYPTIGLDKMYDGSGVLVGVVDVGIDFNHAAFRDENGNTRIQMAQIYDFRDGESIDDIDAIRHTYTSPEEISMLQSDGGPWTHGSHTSCTAAGSPVTLTDGLTIQGMAPKAGLLLSSMYADATGYLYDSFCMDAIFSQVEYAKSVGKPIVINNSYGELSKFCDGKTAFTTFQESVAGPGTILCFSSGNSNNKSQCLEYTFESDTDTLHTLMYDPASFFHEGVSAYIISDDETPFDVKLGCYDFLSAKMLPFAFHTLEENISILEDEALVKGNEAIHDNRYTVKVDLPNGYAGDDRMSVFFISLAVAGQQGKKIRIVYDGCYLESFNIEGYKTGDGTNAFEYHCESDSVISVGSYCTRTTAQRLGQTPANSLVQRHYPSVFSSYGQTVYSKPIPDILAPGEYLLSAFSAYDSTRVNQQTQEPLPNYMYGYSEQFGRRSFYGWMKGTSMACPSAVGIIALWLQADPNLSATQLRDVFQHSCIYYPEISDYPALAKGFGYIKAANGLQYILSKYTPTGFNTYSVGNKYQTTGNKYNMQGVRVNDSYRGIIINEGKKYFVK